MNGFIVGILSGPITPTVRCCISRGASFLDSIGDLPDHTAHGNQRPATHQQQRTNHYGYGKAGTERCCNGQESCDDEQGSDPFRGLRVFTQPTVGIVGLKK